MRWTPTVNICIECPVKCDTKSFYLIFYINNVIVLTLKQQVGTEQNPDCSRLCNIISTIKALPVHKVLFVL